MPIIVAFLTVFSVIAVINLLLYYFGILTLNNKTAIKFIADRSYDGSYFHAVIKRCRGSVKKIIRFKNDGEVTVKLDTDLTYGKVSVSLRRLGAKESFSLSREPKDNYCEAESIVRLANKAKVPYSLTLNFENADGEFWLYIKSGKINSEKQLNSENV